MIAPAVLFEAAHSRDPSVRAALLSAMVDPTWKRLLPEAFSEALELKTEIRRLRSDWLRPNPQLGRYRALLHGWSKKNGGLWDRILTEAEALQLSDADYLHACREQAYRLREDAVKLPLSWRDADLKKTFGSLSMPLLGWDGSPFEPWRLDGLNVLTMAMKIDNHPTREWIEGEIDIEQMLFEQESLTRFWFHEVQSIRMPRHWLRWAFEFLHRLYRTNDGTPADTQIGTYLVDVDLMLSADQRFVAVAERCRMDAPFKIAKSLLIPGGDDAIQGLLDCLTA